MKIQHLFFLLFLILISACEKKEEQKQPLEFTEKAHDFTTERSRKTISHIELTEITHSAGIDFIHETGAFGQKWMPETLGSGGGFLDYNGDGWPDLFLVNSAHWPGQSSDSPAPTPALYENNKDGTFRDVSDKSGLDFSIYGMGCSFADFDADGDMDIYITAMGKNVLLQNDKGYFKDVSANMGVDGNDSRWSTGAMWVDVDRDGWLDLFVANYVKWSPQTDVYTTRDGKTKSYATPDVYKGESCRLYKNLNGKGFEDVTESAGLLNAEGKSLGVAIADFNQDNWPDIVVSNDTQPNFLYLNNGDGSFTNQAVASGIAFDENGLARAGMGIDIADVSNNGKLAIAIGNFSQEPLSLYTQTAGNLFQDRAGAAKLTRSSLLQLTFGVQFSDMDNDGYPEIIAANGHIEPEINQVQKNITFEQRPQIFYNDKGVFNDISDQVGESFKTPVVARGTATADIDRDGDLDLLLTANGGSPKLYRNDSETENKSVSIRLKGTKPNMDAIGAKVTVWHDGVRQNRMIKTGSSYLSQSDLHELIIGIGNSEKIDSLKVTWPRTAKQTVVKDVLAGSSITIAEDELR